MIDGAGNYLAWLQEAYEAVEAAARDVIQGKTGG
jgi:hypothetical protein